MHAMWLSNGIRRVTAAVTTTTSAKAGGKRGPLRDIQQVCVRSFCSGVPLSTSANDSRKQQLAMFSSYVGHIMSREQVVQDLHPRNLPASTTGATLSCTSQKTTRVACETEGFRQSLSGFCGLVSARLPPRHLLPASGGASMRFFASGGRKPPKNDVKQKLAAVHHCLPPSNPPPLEGYDHLTKAELEGLLIALEKAPLRPQAATATENAAAYESLSQFLEHICSLVREKDMSSSANLDQGLCARDFIARAQNRTIEVTESQPQCLLFEGREKAMCSLIQHAATIMTVKKSTRSEIVFVHASPGVGKTRLFQELVTMSSEQRCQLLQESDITSEERLEIPNMLPIHVSFNGNAHASIDLPLLDIDCTPKSFEFFCLLRVIFTWLVDVSEESYGIFVSEIARELKGPNSAKVLTLLTGPKIFDVISIRSGGLRPFLLVDEPLLFEKEHIEKLRKQGVKSSLESELKSMMTRQDGGAKNRKYRIPIAFSALKVGVFARVRSVSGRPLTAVPLELLSFDQGRRILESSLALRRDGDTPTTSGQQSCLKLLCNVVNKDPKDILDAFAALAGGHSRSAEIIVDSVRRCLGMSRKVTMSFVVQHAVMSFAQRYSFDSAVGLNDAVLMAMYNRPVHLNKGFDANGFSNHSRIKVSDLIASGMLMGTSATANMDRIVSTVNLPALSLLGWSLKTDNDAFESSTEGDTEEGEKDSFSYAASAAISEIFIAALSRPSGEAFEIIFAYYTKLQRIVYKEINERGSSLPLAKFVDWTRASIADTYPHYWGDPQLSEAVRNARFDLTQSLTVNNFNKDSGSLPSLRLADIDAMTDDAFHKLTSTIFIPNYGEASGLDHFLVLKDVNGLKDGKRRIVVVAVENKYSKEESSTKISIAADVNSKMEKAKKLLLVDDDVEGKSGGRVSFLFVLAAWRGIKGTPEVLQSNCIIMSKKQLTKVFGKTMTDLLYFLERMRPGLTLESRERDRCM